MLWNPPFKVAILVAFLLVPTAYGDDTPQWKGVGQTPSTASPAVSDATEPIDDAPPIAFPSGPSLARRTSTSASPTTGVRLASANLPADQGQVWREYDLSQYVMRVTSTERPEQAVVDWILRETGYETWHSDTVSILSATRNKLRVYHTPEIQSVVARVVDRFVGSQAQSQTFGLRIVSVNHPNWRAKVQTLLHPVTVQTPGVQAWVLQKEDAAVLLAELRRRGDYREHSSPYLMVHSGQSTMVNLMHPKTYVRDIILQPGVWPGFQPEAGQIDEGFALEFCPLLSLDTRSIDATVKCTVTQVEKTVPVVVDVPASAASPGRTKIEVPQMTNFHFHERFRWPTDQVLLISMGLVAKPATTTTNTLAATLPLGLSGGPGRADLMVMVESKPQETRSTGTPDPQLREAKTYRRRY
ncbi:MAG: hypothetical protein JW888_16835 [Pirellulales bacterium]|nr:hypothetical protein [Pirellulales bacterium]